MLVVRTVPGPVAKHVSTAPCAAALPHEILEKDFFVPNTSGRADHYRGSSMLRDIMQLTPESVMVFFTRTTEEWGCLYFMFNTFEGCNK